MVLWPPHLIAINGYNGYHPTLEKTPKDPDLEKAPKTGTPCFDCADGGSEDPENQDHQGTHELEDNTPHLPPNT